MKLYIDSRYMKNRENDFVLEKREKLY
jgi:hypothetical protein